MARLASVIIANYNYGRFLGDAIESALAQTYAPVEVIVVDDGSTDESRDVIARVGDRVQSILKPNGGQASAWNAGFAASSGDVVVFLDADDVLLPGALARAMLPFDRPGVAKVHWPLVVIDGFGRRSETRVPRQPLSCGDLKGYVVATGPGGHPGHVWPPSSGNAWARSFLTKAMPIAEAAFKVSPDLWLTTLAPLYGSVVALAEPQGYWRIHGTNSSWNTPFDARLEQSIGLWEACAQGLAQHCRVQSLDPDVEQWRRQAWYHRINRALDEACCVVPPGAIFVLADGAEWDTDPIVRDRRRIPMMERGGSYWGPPADDATAIGELARLRALGAEFLIVAWPAFWWLEHYRGWRDHLRMHARLAVDTDLVKVFVLGSDRQQASSRT
jgi:glycosyltransferase involved in cell wall biosynthesis